MRVIAWLGVRVALAARLGTADRRHVRIVGLRTRATTRLGGRPGFARRPCLTCRPRFARGPRFGSGPCIQRGRHLGGVSRLSRLVAALTVATALRLAASAAGTITIAAARLARAVALLAAVSMHLVVAFGARNAPADQLFDRNHRLLVE